MNSIVNGQLVHYEESGSGATIIFLHGWGSELGTFKKLAEALSTKYKVIRLDFPGFGKSPVPDDTWDVGAYAEFVAAFLEKKRIGNVHAMIGHSFGGRVLIKGTAIKLFSPKKIVLIDAAGIKPKTTPKGIILGAMTTTGKTVLSLPGLGSLKSRSTRTFRAKFGSSDYQNAGELSEIFKKTVAEDLSQYLPGIMQPTLLIWGAEDQETPVTDGKLMYAKIPRSELKIYESAGHFAYLDEPEQTLADMTEFLA